MTRYLLNMMAISLLTTSLFAADAPKNGDRESREKAFEAKLSGASLLGAFSIDGRDSSSSKPDRYRIVSAKKLQGDDWVVTSKMKVGENEIDIPIVIKVYWADDTPVMSLTDLTIPGVGTFTARVMFHGDRYAGSWQHGKVGGLMWGAVEKKESEKKDSEKTDAEKSNAEKPNTEKK